MNKRKAFVTISALLFLIIACSPLEHDLTKYLQYIEVSDAVLILLFIFFISYRLNQSFNFKVIDIHKKLKPVIEKFEKQFGDILGKKLRKQLEKVQNLR